MLCSTLPAFIASTARKSAVEMVPTINASLCDAMSESTAGLLALRCLRSSRSSDAKYSRTLRSLERLSVIVRDYPSSHVSPCGAQGEPATVMGHVNL